MKNLSRYLVALLVIVILLMVVSCGGGTPAATGPKPTTNPQHSLTGFENCLQCHKTGPGTVIPTEPDHSSYKNSDCTNCHTVK